MSDAVATAPTSGHALLLGLAGWVDDDLLACGRELVAVGEDALALELLVASLSAARTVLPGRVRSALVDAVERRLGPEVTRTLPSGVPVVAETAHRFAADAGPDGVAGRIAEIALGLPVVARSGARPALTWRLTPAGAAPGPLPHPVLLVVLDDPTPAEVLAYQLGTALARAGVHASVEAFVDDGRLPPYQRTAQAAARPLTRPGSAPTPPTGVELFAPEAAPEETASSGAAAYIDARPAAPPGPGVRPDTSAEARPAARGLTGAGAGPGGIDLGATVPVPFSAVGPVDHPADPGPSGPAPGPAVDGIDEDDGAPGDRIGADELDPGSPGPDDERVADAPPVAWSPPAASGPDHPAPRPAPRRPGRTAPVPGPDRLPAADPADTAAPPLPGQRIEPPAGDRRPHGRPSPATEQAWARDWRDGSWSTPSGGASAPDPDIEPATSPTPSTPRPDTPQPEADRTPPEPPLPRRRTPERSGVDRPTPEERVAEESDGPPDPGEPSDAQGPRHRLDSPNGSSAPEADPAPAPGTSGLDSWLTPNEQQLLRRLQDELSARERGSADPPPPPRNGTHYPPPDEDRPGPG